MANTSRKGFWPVGTVSGSPWQGSVKRFNHGVGEGGVIGVGDMVTQMTTGNANLAVAATTNLLGCMVSREVILKQRPIGTAMALSGQTAVDLSRKHITSLENTALYVCTAPDAIYEVEAANGTPTIALIGENVDMFHVAASTTTGMSAAVVDVGNPVESSAQFKIVGLVERADNEAAANMKVLVMVNEHLYKVATGI